MKRIEYEFLVTTLMIAADEPRPGQISCHDAVMKMLEYLRELIEDGKIED